MRRSPSIALACLLIAAPGLVSAAEGDAAADGAGEDTAGAQAPPGGYPEISGDVSFGALVTSGNTESESANLGVEVGVDYEIWRHTVGATAYQASEGGTDTAERYTASLQSDYKFSERSYLFASLRYATDRFGAFDRRASAAVGVGRSFIETQTIQLALQAGLGRRIEEPAGTNDRDREDIVILDGDFAWQFADNSEFSQVLVIEAGDTNTYTESVTAVKSQLSGALALKISHTIERNSDVPADTENTDAITAVSLEYGF